MENKFYEIMSSHEDEKLLRVYQNKSEYTEEACEAMEQVLRERNLINQANLIDAQSEKNAAEMLEVRNAEYEIRTFGQYISDKEFAASKLQNGTYLERKVSPLQGVSRFAPLFIIIGVSSLVIFLVFLSAGSRPKDMDLFFYLSLGLTVFLPFGIWLTRKSHAVLKLVKSGRNPALVIKDGEKELSVSLPLEYECYYRWETIRRNLKQVRLYFYVFDPLKNETIILTELLPALVDPPENWNTVPKDLKTNNESKSFTNYGFQKPFLEELYKIIKGLN